jgi:hypothetical protein
VANLPSVDLQAPNGTRTGESRTGSARPLERCDQSALPCTPTPAATGASPDDASGRPPSGPDPRRSQAAARHRTAAVDQPVADPAPPGSSRRVYSGQHTRTARDWVRQGWQPDHARQLAAAGHRAGQVLVIDESGVTPLTHYPYHSRGGFDWGHSGAGPADLARCILLDHYAVRPVRSGSLYPPAHSGLPVRYEDFKHDVIARLPRGQDWSLTSDQIDAWAHGMAHGRR